MKKLFCLIFLTIFAAHSPVLAATKATGDWPNITSVTDTKYFLCYNPAAAAGSKEEKITKANLTTQLFTSPSIITSLLPSAATVTLGSTSAEWGGLYLGDGKVIYGQADQSATLTSSASLWTANNFAVDTQFKLPSSNADPTSTAGYLRHDSIIPNFTNGGLTYYNGAAIKQLVDMTTATAQACTDTQVVAYSSSNDLWYCKDDNTGEAGTGDVTGVGDCTGGDCFDGTTDGGTYIKFPNSGGTFWTSLGAGEATANVHWRIPNDAYPSAGTTSLLYTDENGNWHLRASTYYEPDVSWGTGLANSAGTASVDATEFDNITWGAAAGGSQTWTFDTGAGTDPTLTISDTDLTTNKKVIATAFETSAADGTHHINVNNTSENTTSSANDIWSYNGAVLFDAGASNKTFAFLESPAFTTPNIGAATGTSLDISGAAGLTLENDETITNGTDGTVATSSDFMVSGADLSLGSAGVKLTGDGDGAITLLGLGDGSDEDLTINLDDTSNTAVFSSSTGVTKLDFSALQLVTTGVLKGAADVIEDADGRTIDAADAYGSIHFATGAGTWTLPSASAGMSLCVYSTTAAAVVIDAASGDQIKPNTNATGDSFTNDSTAGSFACFVAANTTDWYVFGLKGTWTDTN